MFFTTVRDGDLYYRVRLTVGQAVRHDNGALVSIGLTVGRDLRASTFKRWLKRGLAQPISREEWNR